MAEILAPAGTEEAFQAAIKAGADAVYLGGNRFGARAYAANFEEGSLLKALDLAHLFGKKVYLTVNTLMKEEELDGLYSFLLPYYRAGLDAVIVQDLGAVKMIRSRFPKMHIHASTQMTVTGRFGASLLRTYGIDRVVPARELSLEEIRNIKKHSDIEVECFVHGALCYCYSGQCLMSSMAGGRSGNRGRCAQPCRLPYTVYEKKRKISGDSTAYALNTKDICTLTLIPELIAAGIDSFKIEGRMKRPEYVAGVTRIYRKYHDLALSGGKYEVSGADLEFLSDLFNREGFSQSYYKQHNGPDMMALHNRKRTAGENEKTEKAYVSVQTDILRKELKKELSASVCVTDAEAKLTLSDGMVMGQAVSAEVFPAKTKGVTEEGLQKQIKKTGGTPFEITDVRTEILPGIFMTVGAQNDLRRAALEDYEKNLQNRFERTDETVFVPPSGERQDTRIKAGSLPVLEKNPDSTHKKPAEERTYSSRLAVQVSRKEQFRTAAETESISEIYLPASLAEKIFPDDLPKDGFEGKVMSLSLPAPLRQNGVDRFQKLIRKAADAGWGFLAGSMEEAALLLSMGLADRIRLDAGVYTMNSQSRQFLSEHGITKDTIPFELNRKEIRSRENTLSELVIYGRIPLMISAQCLKKTYDRCTKNDPVLYLTDRKNYNYPVFADCSVCRNTIYNPFPLSLISRKKEVRELRAGSLRFCFTDEDPDRIRGLIAAWQSDQPFEEDFEFTRGHFGRGIE